MSVEIKRYEKFQEAVYIDGKILPRQTIEGPWIEKGMCIVDCFTKGLSTEAMVNPDNVPYQVKPYETRKGEKPPLEITRFYLKYK